MTKDNFVRKYGPDGTFLTSLFSKFTVNNIAIDTLTDDIYIVTTSQSQAYLYQFDHSLNELWNSQLSVTPTNFLVNVLKRDMIITTPSNEVKTLDLDNRSSWVSIDMINVPAGTIFSSEFSLNFL